MTETHISEINVDELMEKIRAEVRRRKERQETVHGPAHQADRTSQLTPFHRIDPFNIGTIPEPEPFEFKEGGYHINDFLKYHDLHFVMNAYGCILGKRPDSEELQHVLKNLRSGKTTKAEVLGRLRYSPEGRAARVKISGLFRNFAIQSSFKIPVLGYFSRITVGLVNLPVILRNMNTLEANTFAQLQAQQNHINTLTDTAQSKINQLIDKRGQVGPVLAQKADRDELGQFKEEVEGVLEQKADKLELSQLGDRKADRDELGQFKEEVEGVLEQKADKLELSELGDRKTDRKELGQFKEEVEGVLEQKADKLELSELGDRKADRGELGQFKEEVEGVLEQKADKLELSELGDRKADKEQIEIINSRIREILRQIRDHKLNILDQQRRLALLLEEARKRLPEPISTDQIEKMLTEEDHLLDAMYVSFEDQFRGTRADIKERFKIYLPYIRNIYSSSEPTILDLGCGRGEWLELLKENGFVAKGTDINNVMVRECKDRGLDVWAGDSGEFLKKQGDNSVSGITAFHLVEHLPVRAMIGLLDEVFRVLKPGGLIILETPNPDNILVGSRNFYIDPTHRNPIPSPTLQFIAEARGFEKTQILNLHSVPDYDKDEAVGEPLNRLLYGPQDYALIGRKL